MSKYQNFTCNVLQKTHTFLVKWSFSWCICIYVKLPMCECLYTNIFIHVKVCLCLNVYLIVSCICAFWFIVCSRCWSLKFEYWFSTEVVIITRLDCCKLFFLLVLKSEHWSACKICDTHMACVCAHMNLLAKWAAIL